MWSCYHVATTSVHKSSTRWNGTKMKKNFTGELNSCESWVGGKSYRHILWWMHSGESWERWIYIKSIMQMCVQTLNLMHMQSNLFSLQPFFVCSILLFVHCAFQIHSFYLFFSLYLTVNETSNVKYEPIMRTPKDMHHWCQQSRTCFSSSRECTSAQITFATISYAQFTLIIWAMNRLAPTAARCLVMLRSFNLRMKQATWRLSVSRFSTYREIYVLKRGYL